MKKIFGLDTLRLFAVILIVIYHIVRQVFPGGFVAIEIFLVLSGFLIAYKLSNELKNGKTNLFKFLWSRIKKFYPAIIATVILGLTLGYFADLDFLARARVHALEALTFSTNIVEIISGGSYEATIMPNIFEHLWFLALIMQVYLIFYVVMCLVKKIANPKNSDRIAAIVCFIIAVISYVIMALIGGKYQEYTRAYFGPDSHLWSFFLGASLALLLKSFNGVKLVFKKWVNYLGVVVCGGLIVYLGIITTFESTDTFVYILPIVALLSMAMIMLILGIQPKNGKCNKLLNVFEYVGSASFYIYLFHWPIFILLPSVFKMDYWLEIAVTIVASIGLAILMDKLIMPKAKKLWQRAWWGKLIYLVALAGLCVVPVLSLIKAPDISSIEEQLNEQAMIEVPKTDDTKELHIDFGGSEKLSAVATDKVLPYLSAMTKYAKQPVYYNYTYPSYSDGYAAGNASGASVLVIGDSVTLGATEALYNMIPGVYVDALGSRGVTSQSGLAGAAEILAAYKASGGLPNIIVLSLITNWRNINSSTWDSIQDVGGWDKQYILVTGFCGNANCGNGATSRISQNNTIYEYAASHANVHVADWFSLAVNDGSLTYSDNTHLSPAGRQAYASLIRGVIDSL